MIFVDTEDQAIEALSNLPNEKAITLLRPNKQALFQEMAQQITMPRDEHIIAAQVFKHFPKLDHKNSPADIVKRAEMMRIGITPEMARIIHADFHEVIAAYLRVYNAVTGLRNTAQGNINIVPAGGEGRTPVFHVDIAAITAHVSVMFSLLQYISGDLPSADWKTLVESDFKRDSHIPESLISEASFGDIVFMRGLDLKGLEETRRKSCIHRSSSLIAETGQLSYNIF